uniref:SH2 domain-containing protein n=1 Tax=Bursaphelenchus xylophilus TaxID=6326 RepID=A0A1I7SGP1_BURXY
MNILKQQPKPFFSAHLDATRRDRRLCNGLDEAIAVPYYWGHIDRHEAAQTLEGLGHGSFLLRDSSHPDFRFAVSFRCADSTVHARIARYKGNYSFKLDDSRRFCAPTLTKFVEHYNKLERFLFDEPYLSKPVFRRRVFSLKEMCNAVIASRVTLNNVDTLPLPSRNIREITQMLEG